MKINREYDLDLDTPADRAIYDAFNSAFELVKNVTHGLPRHESLGVWQGLFQRTGSFTDEYLVAMADLSHAVRKAAKGETATRRIKAADAIDRALMLVNAAAVGATLVRAA